MPILPHPKTIDAETAFIQEIDAWGHDWLLANYPTWIARIEALISTHTPQDIYHIVLRETGSGDIARFCRQAARHVKRQAEQ